MPIQNTAIAVCVACCWILSSQPAAAQPAVFETVDQLWRDFDPESPALEIETSRAWQEDGLSLEKLWFTAEKNAEAKVRVFAYRGAPAAGTRLPGILHIHGGGQTASLEWVKFWAHRGYVCTSYDFTGPWADRKEVTDWGPVTQGNLAKAQGGLLMRPTARDSTWFHWAVVARRALTLLSYHPKVDRERLGIFGVSIGGTLCWLVAGTDQRVKTAVPIYGCGYNHDRRKTAWGFPDLNPELVRFTHLLAPEAYASSIRRPVLLLDATNDFHGWMDDAYRILAETHITHRLALTPRYNHHIEPAQGTDLPAWMDWQLRGGPPFPDAPKLELRLKAGGIPQALIGATDPSIELVDVYYSLGDKAPPNRFWRRAATVKTGPAWQASLPVYKTSETLRTFANVRFRSGVCLTTNLERTTPDRLGAARATLKWSPTPPTESGDPGAPFVFAVANTDPNSVRSYFMASDDPDVNDVVCVNPAIFGGKIHFAIASNYIGDPACRGRDGQSLSFEYRGDFLPEDGAGSTKNKKQEEAPLSHVAGFTVEASAAEFTPRAKFYSVHIDAAATRGWTRVDLAPRSLRTAKNEPLSTWGEMDKITIRGVAAKSNPPRFAKFRWVAR